MTKPNPISSSLSDASLTEPSHRDGSDSQTVVSAPVSARLSHALENDHILNLILSTYDSDIGPGSALKVRKRNLLAISLVSKRFFKLGINHLWRSLISWVPLVKLIGCVVERVKGMLTTDDAISGEHLERYNFYAKLVKRFELSFDAKSPRSQISPHIFPSVLQYEPLGLLPSLESLIITDFNGVVPEDTAFLFSLIPFNNLSTIIIKGLNINTNILANSLLQNIHIKSPTVACLSLQGNFHLSTFRRVGNFSDLRRIDLDFSGMNLLVDVKVSRIVFVALENLRLVGSVHNIQHFMNAVFHDTPRLQNLHMTLVSRNNLISPPLQCVHLDDLIKSIAERKGLSLRSLTITSESRDIHFKSKDSYQVLLPYFDFPSFDQLRSLAIPLESFSSHPLHPSMRPLKMLEHLSIVGGMKELMRYSPSDRSLIPPEVGPKKKTPFPLSKLALFIEMCPNLKSLTIPISLNMDPAQIKKMQTDLKTPMKCHTLERLTLTAFVGPGLSPAVFNTMTRRDYEYEYPTEFHPANNFTELFLFSHYVDHIFPHLREIDTQSLRPFVDNQWLDGLESGVKEFRELRVSHGNSHRCRKWPRVADDLKKETVVI